MKASICSGVGGRPIRLKYKRRARVTASVQGQPEPPKASFAAEDLAKALSGLGISANTEYELTFWSYYGAEARNTTIAGASGTTGATLGPITFVDPPTAISDNTATGTFTSDGSGNLTFTLTSSNSRPALNGFTISPVPEPSAALLGMLGCFLLLRRRR